MLPRKIKTMKSDYQPIVGYLFKDSAIYRVPLYQRHYVWDSINWEHLWDDIEEKSELRLDNGYKEHFTGAIVIQEIVPDALLEIIDGQQRLTTFQIILCAIRDICDEFEDPQDVHGKANDYIRLPTLTPIITGILGPDEQQCKLLPREGTDRDVFLSLVEKNQEQVERKALIWKAYKYFTNKIKEYVTDDYNKLHHLYDSILKDFKVVEITVTSDDEYAKIFKSINGTGRRLDQFDLLRNDLFLRARGIERDNLYERYWHHFEEEPDWREPGVVDDFLENFLKVKLGADFDSQLNLFDLYELYCTKLAKELKFSETDPRLVKYEFYDLNRYSRIYHGINMANSGEIGDRFKFYDQFNDKLNIADQLRLFILSVANEFGLSIHELNRIFDLFEAYVLRAMLYIGSKSYSYNSPPLKKLNSFFLRALKLDGKKNLSLVNLVHLLSTEWPTDEDMEGALDRHHLPQTKVTRKKSTSNLMKEFGGEYIFQALDCWDIDDNAKLFERFCKRWPSAEVMLQKELIGELPIVYSRIPVSVETIGDLGFDSESYASAQTKPRLERYIFVTYQGTRELLEYEIDENSITGIGTNSEEDEIVTLELKEILFAFSAPTMFSLQSCINPTRDDVKNLQLEPVSKQEAFPTRDWLFEEMSGLRTRKEVSNLEHLLLTNTEAIIIVTRAGHELRGIPKSFNDNAIYMEINDHIVTVYMHGIFKLE